MCIIKSIWFTIFLVDKHHWWASCIDHLCKKGWANLGLIFPPSLMYDLTLIFYLTNIKWKATWKLSILGVIFTVQIDSVVLILKNILGTLLPQEVKTPHPKFTGTISHFKPSDTKPLLTGLEMFFFFKRVHHLKLKTTQIWWILQDYIYGKFSKDGNLCFKNIFLTETQSFNFFYWWLL